VAKFADGFVDIGGKICHQLRGTDSWKNTSRTSQHCPFKHNERVAALCRGNSRTPTKTVAVRATLVRFLFRKQVWLFETILVKMAGELLKSARK
jgi:hypothetical protein